MAHDILIVDDEADIRMLVSGILEDEGYSTREAGGSDGALKAVANRRPNLVLLDIWLQGSPIDGLAVLEEIKKDHPDLPVLMMSGHGTVETAVAAIHKGAYDFIEKPFKSDRLLLLVDRAIEAAKLKREVAELKKRSGAVLEQMIGNSPLVNQLRQAIEKAAPTNSRVLITGPAGAGKEVAARLLHQHSKRHDGSFVVLNCAAMHPERMEAELFGFEGDGRDYHRKTGTLELAHGGTLLLDEVADMPLETQGKILRVLQDQSFERVGGSNRVEVDVRVIAATSRDLRQEISAGKFREDLFYRLNVVPLGVPPLKQRRDDIPLLAKFFIECAANGAGSVARELDEETLAALQAYEWPGNVRQLRNIMEWLLIMAPGDAREPIGVEALPPEIGGNAPPSLRADKSSEIMSLPLREAREVFEREYLLAQLNRFSGNISRTATFIGMERSALHRKLKSLNAVFNEKDA